MFELILKGHAEGEAEAESQREEETDQAAAATNDLGEKDTGPRQVKLKSYPQDSFGAQNRSFHHSWYICVVKFHYDPVILSLVLSYTECKQNYRAKSHSFWLNQSMNCLKQWISAAPNGP